MLPEISGADTGGPAKGPVGGLADPDGSPEPPQDPPLPRYGLMLNRYEDHFSLKMMNYLDTLVLHKALDIQDHGMALEVVLEDHLRVLMHWEVHWVWTLGDHLDTCLHLNLEEALVHLEIHLQHIPENRTRLRRAKMQKLFSESMRASDIK